MKKLKEWYKFNAIVRFALSYSIVLIIPILTCIIGTYLACQTIKESVQESNYKMMERTLELFESELMVTMNIASQIAQYEVVNKISDWQGDKDVEFYGLSKEMIDYLGDTLKYRGSNLLDSIDVLLVKNKSYMSSTSGYYDSEFYHQWKSDSNELTYAEWSNLYTQDSQTIKLHYDKNLQVIYPLKEQKGAIICNLNNAKLYEQLDNLLEQDETVVLLNDDGQVYYTSDGKDGNWIPDTSMLTNKQDVFYKNGESVIYFKGNISNLLVMKHIPENQQIDKLDGLVQIEIFLILLTFVIGGYWTYHESKKYGQAVNEFFKQFSNETKAEYTLENIGAVAQDIVNGHEEVLEVLEKDKPLLTQAILGKLIRGEVVSQAELDNFEQRVNRKIRGCSHQVLVFRLFDNMEFYHADTQMVEEARVLSSKVHKMIKEIVDTKVWFYELNYLTTIVVYPIVENGVCAEVVVDRVNEKLKVEGSIRPLWGLTTPCMDISNLWRSVQEARIASEYVTEISENSFLRYDDVKKMQKGYYYPQQYEERFLACIRSHDQEEIKQLLKLSLEENFSVRKLSRKNFLQLNTCFCNSLLKLCDKEILNEQLLMLNELVIQYGEWKPEVYYEELKKAIHVILEQLSQSKRSRSAYLVDQMIYYVEHNFADSNLGLAMMSQEFNISEGYVSMVFKEQAGINFADYVEQKRIEQACRLLKETQNSIQMISEQVGYNSIQSFRRAFKKITGKTPKELREQ